jgi:hypothetical protein
MAVTTKILFPATSNSSTTDFSLSGLQLNNQDDLDVYVTKTTAGIAANNNKRILHFRQSTSSNVDANHNQVNNTDGLYFPAITHTGGTETLENYTLVNNNGTVRFNSALPSGAIVFVERRTRDADSAYTSFASGSTIRATDLNNSSTESNFTAQEARNKAFTIEGVLFRGDQPSTNFVTSDHIVAGTIVTQDIANDAVNADKIADDVVNSEHYVAQSIDTEHIALENITTSLLAPDAVTSAKLADNTVNSEHYVDASIDHVHLANDIIDGDNIQDDVINSEHYVAGSIDHEHLANDIIDGDNIQDSVINSEHYVDGSIDREHLATDIVDGTKIADDSIDSEHIAAGALDNEHYAAGSITSDKLNAATVITAAEQGSATANDTSFLTSAAADARFFNVSTGDTIKDGDTFPDNDTTIATTAAINDRIIDLVDDVGGFVPIANETSFPTANPDVNNGAGTLVSIKSISSTRTPSSGTVTIANGAGSGNTVSITGCGSTVLSAGFGVIVETTTALHTYAFHRLVPKATEVTTVASKATEIGRLGTAATVEDMSILGTTDVVADMAILGTADVVSDLNTLGTADVVADMNTLAVTSVVNNMDTVAGISSDVTTVAGISSDVTAVAADASDIGIVAADGTDIGLVAGSITNVNHVGGDIANVNTVASNISSVNNFANQYRIGSTNPTTSLDTGDLFFNTTSSSLKVYTGSAWVDGVTATGDFALKTGNTFTGSNTYNDNVKAQFGTNADGLEIFHDSNDSIINDNGTGSLKLQNGGSTKIHLTSTGAVVTGNIGVSGTVDGRDVAADGTKLDLIDLNASALTLSGTYPVIKMVDTTSGAQDYRINIIDGIFKIQDNTDTSNVLDRFSILTNGHTSITGNLDVSAGIDVTGTVNITSGNFTCTGSLNTGNELNFTGNSSKFIDFETLDNNHRFELRHHNPTAGTFETAIKATANGAVDLFRDGGLRLRTHAEGVEVRGAEGGNAVVYLYADEGDDATDQIRLLAGNGTGFYLQNKGTGSWVTNLKAAHDGNVELYYQGNKKFETATGGVSVTGALTVTDGSITQSNSGGSENSFGTNVNISTIYPSLSLNDTDSENDWKVQNQNGKFAIHDADRNTNVLTIEGRSGESNYGEVGILGDLLVDNGTSTLLNVKCNNNGNAIVRAGGDSQGTGAFEVSQDNGQHGGGISYNGDSNPAFVTGESSDHITFYRMDNGNRTEVFHYPFNSSVVNFNSVPTVGGTSLVRTSDTITNATNAVNVTGTIASAVTATTQSQGDNSTKVATTAYVDALSIATNLSQGRGPNGYTISSSTGSGTTILAATSSLAGILTSSDKAKLDGIASSANNYSHPNHSGEVTSSGDGAMTIADNVVDEANLKVSNSPVNGYMLTAQSGNTGGLTWAPASTSAGVLQTTYTQLTCANTESSNTSFSTTPEAIIDGCLVKIQITNTNSKILVTYSGMPISAKRQGPATAIIDIGFASSSSASSTFNAGDFTGLGSGPDGGLASARKSSSGTSSSIFRGQDGPSCVQVLHDHNLAVGQYAYYTLMLKSQYSNNSHGYIVGGHSDNVHGCVLQEVM